jgi:hypothetical protein
LNKKRQTLCLTFLFVLNENPNFKNEQLYRQGCTMEKLSLFTLTVLMSLNSFAFSATGHKVVCELAYEQLSSEAKQTIDTLVAVQKWDDFAEACVWPDSSDAAAKARKKLGTHYINVPRTQGYINESQCTQAEHCLFSALDEDLASLKNANSLEEQAESLAYIGHFVADMHQPLHVSFADNLGGNTIKINNSVDCWQNFHSLWDDCVVRKALQNSGVGATNYKAYVQLLLDQNQLSTVSGSSSNTAQWASESLQISRNLNTKYCSDAQCARSPSSLTISDSYLDAHANIAEQQMLLASKRLAKLLNSELSNTSSHGFTLSNNTQSGSMGAVMGFLIMSLVFFVRRKK